MNVRCWLLYLTEEQVSPFYENGKFCNGLPIDIFWTFLKDFCKSSRNPTNPPKKYNIVSLILFIECMESV